MTATLLDAKSLKRYRADPIAFVEECLINPESGKPFVLVDAQRTFLQEALRLRKDGWLRYQDLIFSAPKKSGKTAFAAIFLITIVVLFGPRYGEFFCAANDQEQASRVFELVGRIIQASPVLLGEAKITAEKVTFASTGATVKTLASDYASAAGGHPTVTTFDELWGYTSERARRLWDELVPVPSRKVSCRLVVSYAGFADESDLLHELYRRGLQQPQIGKDLYAGDGLLMFWTHDPVLPTQTPEWVEDMRRSLRPNQYLRMIENRFVTTESSFVDMEWFDRCVDAEARPVFSDRRIAVWVGVDASVKRDSTAIVAVAWDPQAKRVRLITHRIFQPSPDDPLDFESTIEATLLDWRQRFQVREIRYDPYQMASVAQRLARAGLPMEEFPQSVPNLTAIGSNLYELVKGAGISFYPDHAIRLAMSRAVAVETSRGWRLAKEKQAFKIDVIVALAMAAHAAVEDQTAPMRVAKEAAENIPVYRRQSSIALYGERRALMMERQRMMQFR